mgnify:CR=1 FL=1
MVSFFFQYDGQIFHLQAHHCGGEENQQGKGVCNLKGCRNFTGSLCCSRIKSTCARKAQPAPNLQKHIFYVKIPANLIQ